MATPLRSFDGLVPLTLGNGRYEIRGLLGTGGMAGVYEAFDTWEKAERAVKVLYPPGSSVEKARRRFLKEAGTMVQLDHAHIARVYAVGEEPPYYYSVMQLARGGSLSGWVKSNGKMAPEIVCRLALQVLSALAYAHVAGVIHRDVKPQNILLDAEHRHTLLTDFGIARLVHSNASRITATGDILGTMAYMAPEQRHDPREVGPSADVYGVGATMYLLLTARRPIDLAVAGYDKSVYERIPEAMRGVVQRATHPLQGQRYTTAEAMAEDLLGVLHLIDGVGVAESPPASPYDPDDDTTVMQVVDRER